MHVLALNSGSSTLKFGLHRVDAEGSEELMGETLRGVDAGQAMVDIEKRLAGSRMPATQAIGHRIVHGGPLLRQHRRIDAGALQQLDAACAYAPLHTPAALALIRCAQEHFPGLPHVACFDTTFHNALPDVARVLPIAREWQAQGIQRYGFHGLSCESIVRQLAPELPHRLLIAHLGHGASVTAVLGGRSIDTSMGLTPSGGVMMGTRSGDLDPGVLLHLMREQKFDAARLEELVDRRSGLLGVSGVGSDMRGLHEAAATNADARLAIAMFCYSVRKQLAAMIAALDGADALVFTGGIGENDAQVRAEICAGLAWIGVGLDAARNRSASNPISADASRCAVHVLPSKEDEEIARHTRAVLAGP